VVYVHCVQRFYDFAVCSSDESYVALPPELWHLLHREFGGGPCIPRYCVDTGCDNEVFDLPLTVYLLCGPRHSKLRIPRHLPFDTFQAAAEQALKIPPQESDKYHMVSESDSVDLTEQVQESRRRETLDTLNVQVRCLTS
jgi:hypothetical protein